MNGSGEQNNKARVWAMPRAQLRTAAAVLLIGAAAASTCRAESQARSAGQGPMSASAHIDFRVTVLPSLALSMRAQGAQVRGNTGVLTLQSSRSGVDDGVTPGSSQQLRPRNLVIDTALPRSAVGTGDVVTIASP